MNIGEILTKAGQIVWKYKILWLFGILAGCVEGIGGGGGGGGGGGSGARPTPDGQGFELPPQIESWFRDLPLFFRNFDINPEQYAGLAVIILLLFCVFGLLALSLGTIGRIGLIKGASLADQGAESLSLGELWSSTLPYFGRVFGLWLILWLTSFVVGISIWVAAILAALVSMGIGLICLLPLLCAFVPVFWLASLIFEQATIALVTEERSIPQALSRAWALIRANFGNYLLMSLMLFIIQLAVGFVISIPAFIIVVPVFLSIFSGVPETIRTTLFVMGACFVVYIPLAIVLNGLLRAYVWSAWTLTFRRVSAGPVSPANPIEVLDAS